MLLLRRHLRIDSSSSSACSFSISRPSSETLMRPNPTIIGICVQRNEMMPKLPKAPIARGTAGIHRSDVIRSYTGAILIRQIA